MSDQHPPPPGGDDQPERPQQGTPPQPSPWGPDPGPGSTPAPEPFDRPPSYGQPPSYDQPPPSAWGRPEDTTAPPYGHGVAPSRNSMAVPALIISILSLPFCCGPLSAVGLFMGRAEIKAIDRGEGDPSQRGVATAAYVIGIIGTALFLLGALGYLLLIALAIATPA